MKKLALMMIAAMAPLCAHAITYYKNVGGNLTKIDAAAFGACETIVYRTVGYSEIGPDVKRKAMAAALRAEAVGDPSSAAKQAKAQSGACTYGLDSETMN